jgi:hypothetical protein
LICQRFFEKPSLPLFPCALEQLVLYKMYDASQLPVRSSCALTTTMQPVQVHHGLAPPLPYLLLQDEARWSFSPLLHSRTAANAITSAIRASCGATLGPAQRMSRPRLPTSRLPTSRLTSLRSTSRLHTSRRSTNHRPISRLHTSRRSTSRRPISLRFPIHHRLPSQVRGSRIPLQAHLRHRVLFNEVRMQSHPDLLQIR